MGAYLNWAIINGETSVSVSVQMWLSHAGNILRQYHFTGVGCPDMYSQIETLFAELPPGPMYKPVTRYIHLPVCQRTSDRLDLARCQSYKFNPRVTKTFPWGLYLFR